MLMEARLIEKFQGRDLLPNGGCLDWPGETDKDGYGVVRAGHRRTGGTKARAPRVAWAASHPGEPLPVVVRHLCDRPVCVNPEHLVGGGHRENAMDSVERGRWRGGNGALSMLDLTECHVCSEGFKPYVIRKGVRKMHCSKSCARSCANKGTGCGGGT